MIIRHTLSVTCDHSSALIVTNCVRNIIEKAVSIRLIVPQNREVKKFQLHIIDQCFEHSGKGICDQKKLKRGKGGAHFMQA